MLPLFVSKLYCVIRADATVLSEAHPAHFLIKYGRITNAKIRMTKHEMDAGRVSAFSSAFVMLSFFRHSSLEIRHCD